MKPTIHLGRWFGIPIGLHYSWFVVAWLITLSLGSQFASQNPGWGTTVVWTTALATALLFFGCIVLHELSHAMVARFTGLPVRGITLFALGGVASIGREATGPVKEFWMAIAGPLASVGIGLACHVAAGALGWRSSGGASTPLAAMLGWLGYINIGLALFNLLPGFPLDGGRVLRALLWAMTGSADRSMRIAARIGQGVAFVFVALGLYRLLAQSDVGGLWLAFVGWFLLEAARANYAQVELTASLRGVRVGTIMARDCATVDGDTTIQVFVDQQLLKTGERCYVVSHDHQIVGLVTPHEIASVERDRWPRTKVSDVMRPLETLRTVKPETRATHALALMSREDVNQLPVVRDGHFEGVVARSHILQLLQLRAELMTPQ